ncbi:baseplate J/gp47 family protein [Streptomyces zaomyceticus]|uniref:baseplate J/gp47 family protein n=1 Tax=Streptomyces zaomyceticus TaxID=68286 RepID=UPI0034185B9D
MAALLRRASGWLPEWQPDPYGLSSGLAHGYGALLELLADRVAALPDRQFADFLDRLGVSPLPPQAASVPVVLEPVRGAVTGRIAAGTRLGASVPGQDVPLPFETETDIALIGASPADVWSVVPEADSAVDHTADVLARRPFTLFSGVRRTRREFYLGHDTVLAFAGPSAVDVRITLATPSSVPLRLEWSWWDGKRWRGFAPWGDGPGDSRDGTSGLTGSGTVTLVAPSADARPTEVRGISSYWLRARLITPLVAARGRTAPEAAAVLLIGNTRSVAAGVRPDVVVADEVPVDVTRAFAPLGQSPRPGSVCHVACDAVFAKPGAAVTVSVERVKGESELVQDLSGGMTPPKALEAPKLAWEYFDGTVWRTLELSGGAPSGTTDLLHPGKGTFAFTVPPDWTVSSVAGAEHRWLRARMLSGSYSAVRLYDVGDEKTVVVENRPPLLAPLDLSHRYAPAPAPPQHVVVRDDRTWRERPATGPRTTIPLFHPLPEESPTLYLGFEGDLPADRLGLYVELDESGALRPPGRLVWEGHDGTGWVALEHEDGTAGLSRSGIVTVTWPGDAGPTGVPVTLAHEGTIVLPGKGAATRFAVGESLLLSDARGAEVVVVRAVQGETVWLRDPVSRPYVGGELRDAPLARFGTPRSWLRARFPAESDPPAVTVVLMAPDAVYARQSVTMADELLGSGDGTPGQVLRCRHAPVLGELVLEVRESEGSRTEAEVSLLAARLEDEGAERLRVVTDPRTGRATEAWVRWAEVPSLAAAGPDDRVFACDRTAGRFLFGGDGHGTPLPFGGDNVRLRSYRTGGGHAGNVPAGALDQVTGAAGVAGVRNPGPAAGGADAESFGAVLARGPSVLRHRQVAVTEEDVMAVVRMTEPGVARVRALGAEDRHGRELAGALRVVVVPRDGSPRPSPTAELRRRVREALGPRLPATAVPGLVVDGPRYRSVGASVTVRPARDEDPGPVRAAIRAALATFLHPLEGGPEGTGWDFGRPVHVSDVARALTAVPGVDVLTRLDLVVDGAPAGDRVDIPPDAIACAGPFDVLLAAQER